MAGISLEQRTISTRARVRRWSVDEPLDTLPAAHRGVEVAWCTAGRAEYHAQGRTVALLPGDAIVVSAMVRHANEAAVGTRAASILLATDAVRAAARAIERRVIGVHVQKSDGASPSRLATKGEGLCRAAWSGAPCDVLEPLIDRVMAEVLAVAAEHERPTTHPRIQRAVDAIDARYAEAISVDQLAAIARMSPFHFARSFRRVTGQTPHQYLLQVRLSRAAEILATRTCSVTEASLLVGWNDVGRFARVFRERYGVPPREFGRRPSAD
jgi:AraC family transcriptional regulator